MSHPSPERLNDFIDGAVSERDRSAMSAHVENCDYCRLELDAWYSVLAEAATLSGQTVPPRRDLWPDIRRRIDRERNSAPARFRVVPGGWWMPRRLAVAAAVVVLVAASSLMTAFFLSRNQRMELGYSEGGRVALTAFQAAETDYAEATRQLLAAYEARRGRLSPETVRIVEENLRIIDGALQKSRAALEADPGNRSLSDLTAAAYQKKVDFLRRTLSLSS